MIYVYDTNSKIYNKNIIDRTRNVLISIHDVDENDIQQFLDSVYIDDFADYNDYKDICNSIFNDIQMGKWDSSYDEIIQFAGATVLPECLIQEYEGYVQDKKYHDANSLLVNISEGKYKSAIVNSAIDVDNGYIYSP